MDDENLPPSRHREILHQRKIAKPLMEKRRRERINNCLDQLKSLLMEVTKKDEDEENSYRSKLEKADILEMTVNYLKTVKRQKMSGALLTSNDPAATSQSRYMAGFRECTEEVTKYLEKTEGLSAATRATLLHHLAGRLQQSSAETPRKRGCLQTFSTPQHHSNPPSCLQQTPVVSVACVDKPSGSLTSYPVQLLPAKLATGETVYVLANPATPCNVIMPDVVMTEHRKSSLNTTSSTTNMSTEIDSKTIIENDYEAISPAGSSDQPGDSEPQECGKLLHPITFASCSSHINLQTTSIRPPGVCFESVRNSDSARTMAQNNHSNLVFSRAVLPPRTLEDESKLVLHHGAVLADDILSPNDQALLPMFPRIPNRLAAGVAIRDQASVWRPW